MTSDTLLSIIAGAVLALSFMYVSRGFISQIFRRTKEAPALDIKRQLEQEIIERRLRDIKRDGPDAISAALEDLKQLKAIFPQDNETEARKGSEVSVDPPVSRVGYSIFKWLLGLIAVMVSLLTLYALFTFPSKEDVLFLARSSGWGSSEEGISSAYKTLQGEWFAQLKDLGQMFLLTPIFPLLGAVIGYIFGVRKTAVESKNPDAKGPDSEKNAP